MTARSLTTSPVQASAKASTEAVRTAVYLAQALLDLLAITLAFSMAYFVRHGDIDADREASFFFLVIPIFMIANFYARAYTYEALMSLTTAVGRILGALAVTLAIHLLILFATKDSSDISRVVFFVGASLSVVLLVAARFPMLWVVRALGNRFMRRMLVIDGVPLTAPPHFEVIDAGALGIRPDVNDPFMLHNFSTLVAGADRVVVSCDASKRAQWAIYLKGTGCWGELLVPELLGIAPVHDEPQLGVVGIRVSTGPLDLSNRLLKRIFDLVLTVPTVVLLTPIMVIVAIAIKLDSQGPVLFRQTRMGRGNRLFHVYKFRSMRVERTDHDGARSASRDDDRITRVGRIIRATSIDELPQLLNVIEGDMSLVGPRPHALGSLAGERLFWHVDERYWLRHAIKPGITGLAQVRGFRGATEHSDDLSKRLQSDLEYVSNWSILRDISILLRTLMVVVHKNAY